MSGEPRRIGLIGGSGLYGMEGLTDVSEVAVDTPFGSPSDRFLVGKLSGVPVVFLARHGRGHLALPSELNFRANVWGFKRLGCEALLSASACGSMKGGYHPTDIVLADQYIDRTHRRVATFFGDGCVAHVSMAHPVCPELLGTLAKAGRAAGATVHEGGVYLGIEGPQFSTKAESNLYRSWGVDVIGMTNVQEAKLCREAELCYASMAMVTDYDCWHEEERPVTVEQVIGVLSANAAMASKILASAVLAVDADRKCSCREGLRFAILTAPKDVPRATREKLALLTEKYWR